MPSSYSFVQSNSSSSSSENDSKSDQSDDDNTHTNKIRAFKKRTIQNDNDMLERPSDSDDDSDDENDIHMPSTIPESYLLPRQSTLYEDNWRIDENKSQKMTTLGEFERNDSLFIDSNSSPIFSPERSQSLDLVDKKYHQPRNHQTFIESDLAASAQQLQLVPQMDTTNKIEDKRRQLSKIPVRTNSSSQSRSRSPPTKPNATNHPSKIPLPVSTTTSKGAFRFFTADERPQLPPKIESAKVSKPSTKQVSPFTPITPAKTGSAIKKTTTSSAGNTPSAKTRRISMPIPSSDDDDDDDGVESTNVKEAELKLKLKQEKRYGKKTGELLEKLHENYEELLEKYAQAENTIDQLRFQPKLLGEYTPTSTASEGVIHFVHQAKTNMAAVRSSGIYRTTPTTPVSSIRQVPSTTTTTTPVIKSSSPANSCAIESVFFDEPLPQKIIVQELTTPETLKLDLLIQTKTLSDKMKAFMTLMDANQLSLAEQQQVYESIKDDYEKLLKTLEEKKRSSDFSDIDLDGDLNQELETMKQLLKEIVKRITDNLLGKTNQSFDLGRQNGSNKNDADTSQLSVRSSLCNHNDLMNQYERLLTAVNTESPEKKPIQTKLSRQSSSEHLTSPNKQTKAYVYVSGNSDDEQQVSSIKNLETTSFNLDHIPSQLARQINEEQTHIRGLATSAGTKKKKSTNKKDQQQYDNLDNMTKNKRKSRKSKNHYEAEKDLSPSTLSIPTVATRHSASSLRTRTSDYDSGIGTTNTTKLSRDSRLNTSTMDESHYQSLDDDRRRYTDDDQESMSTVSSSSSSSLSSNLYNKYTKRFHSTSTLKSRQRPNVHSDVHQSDTDTHLTGSFDPLPPPPLFSSPSSTVKRSRQSKRANSLNSFRRSQSTEDFDRTRISSKNLDLYSPMSRKYRSGFVHSKKPNEIMYKSSFYIDQPHTHQRTITTTATNNVQQRQNSNTKDLYFDPQTGVIYRYVSNKTQTTTPTVNYYQQTSTAKDSYKCQECGSVTNYYHRHHIHDHVRRMPTDIDDLGYESGHKRVHRRYIEQLNTSDSEPDDRNYLELSILNEAYERAKKVQHHSQNLSRHISRQLRLVLTTI